MRNTRKIVVTAMVIALVATGANAKRAAQPIRPALSALPAPAVAIPSLPAPVIEQIRPIVTDAIAEIKPIVAEIRAEDRPPTSTELGAIRDIRADARAAIDDVLATNNLPPLPERPALPRRIAH